MNKYDTKAVRLSFKVCTECWQPDAATPCPQFGPLKSATQHAICKLPLHAAPGRYRRGREAHGYGRSPRSAAGGAVANLQPPNYSEEIRYAQ